METIQLQIEQMQEEVSKLCGVVWCEGLLFLCMH